MMLSITAEYFESTNILLANSFRILAIYSISCIMQCQTEGFVSLIIS